MAKYGVAVTALLGETLTEVHGAEVGSERVTFVTESGRSFSLYHESDCCESVSLNAIIGNVADIVGSPLRMADEATNETDPGPPSEHCESYTWTFYRFATGKGYVTLRWLGESNGYYSERVSFCENCGVNNQQEKGMADPIETQADGAWDPSRFKSHAEEIAAMMEQKAKLTERPYGLDRANCPACNGEGKGNGARCEDCRGTGKELTRDDHLTVEEDGEEPQAEGNYYSSERMDDARRIGH